MRLLPERLAVSIERYRVRIDKDFLVFSAGHFITFDGDVCERLHGHNYRVAAEVEGPLDENHYVVDFVALRDTLRGILESVDFVVRVGVEVAADFVGARVRRVVVKGGAAS